MARKPHSCEIRIINDSGSISSYAIYAEAPSIEPAPPTGTVSSRVLVSVRGVASATGEATCRLPQGGVTALCGISDEHDSSEGASIGVSILDRSPATLSQELDDGGWRAGSLHSMCLDGSTPRFFSEKAEHTDASKDACFYVETCAGFTTRQAQDAGFMIGYGSQQSSRLSRRGAPYYASFTPAPGTTYAITPSKRYFVTVSSASCGSAVTHRMEKIACLVDFDAVNSDFVQVRHLASGALIIYRGSDLNNA